MSSSSRKPFQDITKGQSEDPKEKKRQRERERYAKNKDEILKRRHQLRELKKLSTTPVNDDNTRCDTQAIGQSGVTQVQYMDTEEGMAPDVQRDESQTNLGNNSLVGVESDWLHRCDAYQMQAKPGGMRPNLITQNSFLAAGSLTPLTAVDDIVGCNKVSLEKQQTGHGWYAGLSVDKKTEYLQRLRIARQQKKSAATSDVEVSPYTPLSNVTINDTNGICEYASPVPMDPQTPVSESAMEHVSTSASIHGQQSFLARSADSEKRRQHRRKFISEKKFLLCLNGDVHCTCTFTSIYKRNIHIRAKINTLHCNDGP